MVTQSIVTLLEEKVRCITEAWEKFAPAKMFSGLTLGEFKELCQTPLHSGSSIHHLAERVEAILLIQDGVRSDPKLGQHNSLLQAFQFTPDRETGGPLSRET